MEVPAGVAQCKSGVTLHCEDTLLATGAVGVHQQRALAGEQVGGVEAVIVAARDITPRVRAAQERLVLYGQPQRPLTGCRRGGSPGLLDRGEPPTQDLPADLEIG